MHQSFFQGGDIEFCHFSAISDCHVLLIAINANDNSAFISKLIEMIPVDKAVTVFCMQRGVRSSGLLKEGYVTRHSAWYHYTAFESPWSKLNINYIYHLHIFYFPRLSNRKGFTVIECVVCFAVVPHPATGALTATISSSGLVLERLSREMVKVADGPVNLIEYTKIPITFKKILTRKDYSFSILLQFAWHCFACVACFFIAL